jgi:DNA repair exonuclease SbcCD ATPase subunit
LQTKLGKFDHSQKSQLHTQLGTAQAERAQLEQEAQRIKANYASLKQSTCSQCGQLIPQAQLDPLLLAAEQELQAVSGRLQTVDARVSNLQQQLHQLDTRDTAQENGLRAELAETTTKLQKCTEATVAFARLREKLANAEKDLTAVVASEEQVRSTPNPYRQQAAQHQQQLQTLRTRVAGDEQVVFLRTLAVESYRYWERGFGHAGLPLLVLRPVLRDLELRANRYLAALTSNRIQLGVELENDAIQLRFWERKGDVLWERQYGQLSGGQRRCAELAFTPFALSDLVFQRLGVRIELAAIDELTTHMDAAMKSALPDLLAQFERETILVAEHDVLLQGTFDNIVDMAAA